MVSSPTNLVREAVEINKHNDNFYRQEKILNLKYILASKNRKEFKNFETIQKQILGVCLFWCRRSFINTLVTFSNKNKNYPNTS